MYLSHKIISILMRNYYCKHCSIAFFCNGMQLYWTAAFPENNSWKVFCSIFQSTEIWERSRFEAEVERQILPTTKRKVGGRGISFSKDPAKDNSLRTISTWNVRVQNLKELLTPVRPHKLLVYIIYRKDGKYMVEN